MTTFDYVRICLFLAATLALVVVSRRALLNVRSHGFYRFFAWEAIAALILWNAPFWFSDPFSVRQLFSWVVLILSLVVLWQGVTQLRTGNQNDTRSDRELFPFERTSTLVSSGIFRYIRHPLYASLLYLAWGAFLKDVSWISTVLLAVACVSLVATAKSDERECIQHFGLQYEEYRKRTKMFIPSLF